MKKNSKLKIIEDEAFANNKNLKSFTIYENLISIGEDVFLNSGIVEFNIIYNNNFSF